jgi:phage tail protein X
MTTTTILPGETLFDVAVRVYGHTQGVAQLCSDNGVNMTDELPAGMELLYDESVLYDTGSVVISLSPQVLSNQIAVEAGQNIFDIALQMYGNIEGIIDIARDNGKDMTSELTPGELIVGSDEAIDILVRDFYAGRGILPATGLTSEESAVLKPEGIGYWAIDYDFIVS